MKYWQHNFERMTQHELDTIIQSGEGYKTEFKRNVNTDLSKELAAFANASGGRIFIGIEDNGTVSGVAIDNALKSKVQMMAHDCDPSVEIELSSFRNVLIINVPEGKDKPYRCTNGFYIRNGASSIKLGTRQIIDFIQSEGKVKFDELCNKAVKYPAQLYDAAINRYKKLAGITTAITNHELLTNLGLLYTGEETALLSSLEGFRGHPRMKPPFPAVEGVYACPTVVNNVETLTAVPQIIEMGGLAWRDLGTEKSGGTKLWSVSGHVKKPGVYELPMGYDDLEKFIFNSLKDYFSTNYTSDILENDQKSSTTKEDVIACFSIMDENTRKILALRYVENLSFEEIASRLNYSNPFIAEHEFNKAFNQFENISRARLMLQEEP